MTQKQKIELAIQWLEHEIRSKNSQLDELRSELSRHHETEPTDVIGIPDHRVDGDGGGKKKTWTPEQKARQTEIMRQIWQKRRKAQKAAAR